ncbi:hypothetical protein D9757_011901 [Collybiopsis confluens]|uniref:NAD(P)-binding protein n=1 Tax=Collybiopsis confluens TaxID=2823264 RepID=A0A8H5GGJ9_9AGAR|nr:hypothetical protein D9757_011901 [Collybiopsis confluens]
MSVPRVWLITGTSSGFGRRFVTSILRRGDKVIASARNLNAIRKEEFFPQSDRLRTMQLDVSADEPTIKDKAREALSFWGRVDVLINNAGYSFKVLAEDARWAPPSSLRVTQFQTNLYGPAALTTALLPQMRSRKEGTIVMIGSRSSWNPIETLSLYAASKAALRVYSESLAKELSVLYPNIRIIIVEPSGFRTEQNVLGYPFHIPANPDPVYDAMRRRTQELLVALDGKQRGDPQKAVEVIIDAVRGEGVARARLDVSSSGSGSVSPIYLPLGREANSDIEAKCAKMVEVVKTWRDVTDDLDHDGTDSVDLTRWGNN